MKKITEFLTSMRLAIAWLVLLAIASVIGTILVQQSSEEKTLQQFGLFWNQAFQQLSLFDIYHAPWFTGIVFFLLLSTSLCVIRYAPKIMRDYRRARQSSILEQLQKCTYQKQWQVVQHAETLEHELDKLAQQWRLTKREPGVWQAGSRYTRRWGYLLTHIAIVLICAGALLDSDIWMRWQLFFAQKTWLQTQATTLLLPEVAEKHRLHQDNPSFRAHLWIRENDSQHAAVIESRDGVLIQDLPFSVTLKRFVIDHYLNGMPRSYRSEIVLHDGEKTIPATIAVNHPMTYKGITFYQSGFVDGGSVLTASLHFLDGEGKSQTLTVKADQQENFAYKNRHYQVETMVFKAHNIEPIERSEGSNTSQPHLDFLNNSWAGSRYEMHDFGPRWEYRIRDDQGEAQEFLNYLRPVAIGQHYFQVFGIRKTPQDSWQYLRIPVNKRHGVQEWLQLRAALHKPSWRRQAAMRYLTTLASTSWNAEMRAQILETCLSLLQKFSGVSSEKNKEGLTAIADFIAQQVPKSEQEQVAMSSIKLLHGIMWELWQMSREHRALMPVTAEKDFEFMNHSIFALSEAAVYALPVLLQLENVQERQASILQLNRSPGKNIVYSAFFALLAGLFLLFYCRHGQVWLVMLSKPSAEPLHHVYLAFSGQKQDKRAQKFFTTLTRELNMILLSYSQ